MFHLTPDDFVPQVKGILTVGEFYELAAGAQIIFTEEDGRCASTTKPNGARHLGGFDNG
jgi:hypothetical protein